MRFAFDAPQPRFKDYWGRPLPARTTNYFGETAAQVRKRERKREAEAEAKMKKFNAQQLDKKRLGLADDAPIDAVNGPSDLQYQRGEREKKYNRMLREARSSREIERIADWIEGELGTGHPLQQRANEMASNLRKRGMDAPTVGQKYYVQLNWVQKRYDVMEVRSGRVIAHAKTQDEANSKADQLNRNFEARGNKAYDMATDPPVSEAQRRAMFAAKEGESTLGIPKKVGAEFASADPGGKLPAHAKDVDRYSVYELDDDEFYVIRSSNQKRMRGPFHNRRDAEYTANKMNSKPDAGDKEPPLRDEDRFKAPGDPWNKPKANDVESSLHGALNENHAARAARDAETSYRNGYEDARAGRAPSPPSSGGVEQIKDYHEGHRQGTKDRKAGEAVRSGTIRRLQGR